jgi:P-type Cu2+ transporter
MSESALLAPVLGAPASRACAHCGETLRGAAEARFCCNGCASAYAIIGAAGLGSFYRRLEENRARRPEPIETDYASHVRTRGRDECELDLLVDGLDCAACVWLIENLLARNQTVLKARANLSTRRLALR